MVTVPDCCCCLRTEFFFVEANQHRALLKKARVLPIFCTLLRGVSIGLPALTCLDFAYSFSSSVYLLTFCMLRSSPQEFFAGKSSRTGT